MVLSTRPASITRGVSRSSRTWEAGCDGRVGRARRARSVRTAKACGPDLPTLGSSPAGRFRRATEAIKPGLRGERAISGKPSRRECRNVRRTCRDLRACIPSFCTQGCGCVSASGIPCALFTSRADDDAELGRKSRRGNIDARHCELFEI
jgi:hypothetical protein